MTTLLEILVRARDSGDVRVLSEAIPYSRFLGIDMENVGGELVARMAYSDKLIGNLGIPALHGGTLGGLLETTAAFTTLMRTETVRVPKTISITIDYLRSGRPVDTLCAAEITKLGRRVASVRAIAWQEDRAKPIAAANAHLLLVPIEAPGGAEGPLTGPAHQTGPIGPQGV